jgi:hypothetical protein
VKLLKFEEKIDKAIALKSGSCASCEGIFPTPVFRFWSEKGVFQISRAKNMSWERLKEILEKYELLCLNCMTIRNWEIDDN